LGWLHHVELWWFVRTAALGDNDGWRNGADTHARAALFSTLLVINFGMPDVCNKYVYVVKIKQLLSQLNAADFLHPGG